MTATLTILAAAVLVAVLLADRLERRARRRDRQIMRLLHTYMAKLPPAKR